MQVNKFRLIISYKASVFTPAGWRSVTIRAAAEQISAGMAKVTEVLAIDGNVPSSTMSRTGARRQQFSGTSIAAREVGTKKRLSSCAIGCPI